MKSQIIVLAEKHDDRIIGPIANDVEREGQCQLIVHQRISDGYWYDAETTKLAQAAVDREHAYEFLQSRAHHEYEGMYIQYMEKLG